jgi:hypothetical protein
MAGLENYPFLTPRVEIKKSNLYGVSMGGNLCRFSNAAAKSVWWNIPSAQNSRSILQVPLGCDFHRLFHRRLGRNTPKWDVKDDV